MAEVREVFTILEDSGGAGVPLLAKSVGDAPTALNSQESFAFIDNAGNLIKPQLTATGALPVDTGGVAGTAASDTATVTMAALNTEQDVVSLNIAVNDVINCSMAMGASFQPMLWTLYHDDDGALTALATFVTGPGDFSHTAEMDNINFTAGAVGNQFLKLRATQLRGGLTDAHGTISLINLG